MPFPKMYGSLDSPVFFRDVRKSNSTAGKSWSDTPCDSSRLPTAVSGANLWAAPLELRDSILWGREEKLHRSSKGLTLLARQDEAISLYNKLTITCYCILKFQSFVTKKRSRCDYILFFLTSIVFPTHIFPKISKPVLCIFTHLHKHLNCISLWIGNILSLSCRSNSI